MSRPVKGSASAATSADSLLVAQPVAEKPATFCCQGWAVKNLLQPPPVAPSSDSASLSGPLPFHTFSLVRSALAFRLSVVPPTETTDGSEAGTLGDSGSGSGPSHQS